MHALMMLLLLLVPIVAVPEAIGVGSAASYTHGIHRARRLR